MSLCISSHLLSFVCFSAARLNLSCSRSVTPNATSATFYGFKEQRTRNSDVIEIASFKTLKVRPSFPSFPSLAVLAHALLLLPRTRTSSNVRSTMVRPSRTAPSVLDRLERPPPPISAFFRAFNSQSSFSVYRDSARLVSNGPFL